MSRIEREKSRGKLERTGLAFALLFSSKTFPIEAPEDEPDVTSGVPDSVRQESGAPYEQYRFLKPVSAEDFSAPEWLVEKLPEIDSDDIDLIGQVGEEFNIDPKVLLSFLTVESMGRNVTSSSGAVGYFQITSETVEFLQDNSREYLNLADKQKSLDLREEELDNLDDLLVGAFWASVYLKEAGVPWGQVYQERLASQDYRKALGKTAILYHDGLFSQSENPSATAQLEKERVLGVMDFLAGRKGKSELNSDLQRFLGVSEKKPPSKKESHISKEQEKIVKPVRWGRRDQTEVALTFDDGFSRNSVERVLETLDKTGDKCTFFVVGRQLEANPDLWRQAVDSGHQICNHTYSHVYLTSLSDEQIEEEIEAWEEEVKKVLGQEYCNKMRSEFPYIRLPGGAGHRSKRVLSLLEKKGYRPIAWSQETYHSVLKNCDYKEESVEIIASEVSDHTVKRVDNGSIILLHFNVWDTFNLGETIEGINDKGFKLTTVAGVLN